MGTPARAASARLVLLWLVGAAFVASNLYNALKKGGDFTVFLESGRRLLEGSPLYAGSRVAEGIIGPPFQAVFFAPFAALATLSEPAARVSWYGLNLGALALAVECWRRAMGASGRDALVALLAIAHPLQANFQHQNLNVVLLAFTGAAALCATTRRDVAGGALVGAATALKAFPAILVVELAQRRAWRAALTAGSTALVLTALPLARYGPGGWARTMGEWFGLSGTGDWPVRSHNQSLFAMIGRWLGPEGITATGALSYADAPVAYWVWGLAVAGLLAWGGLAMARHDRGAVGPPSAGMALALGIGVLASPIAWDHYWVLFYPLLLHVCLGRTQRVTDLPAAFWAAAVLINAPGLLPRDAWRLTRWVSTRTVAGLVLVATACRRSCPEGADAHRRLA